MTWEMGAGWGGTEKRRKEPIGNLRETKQVELRTKGFFCLLLLLGVRQACFSVHQGGDTDGVALGKGGGS